MNNKGVGAVFCLISAILFAARYIAVAIFISGVTSWDAEIFKAGLEYVGPVLPILAGVSLVAGIAFLVVGEINDKR